MVVYGWKAVAGQNFYSIADTDTWLSEDSMGTASAVKASSYDGPLEVYFDVGDGLSDDMLTAEWEFSSHFSDMNLWLYFHLHGSSIVVERLS